MAEEPPERGRPAFIRGIVAETISAVESAALVWCREHFEENPRRNRCQEILQVYARNLQAPHVEEETKRDIACTALIDEPRSPLAFDECRKLWGDPSTTDPALVAQRERTLRARYDPGDLARGASLGKDLDATLFKAPYLVEEARRAALTADVTELQPGISPDSGMSPDVLARQAAVLGAESAAPAPSRTVRLRRPGAPPMGRPPSLLASTPRRGSAAQGLADAVLTQKLTAVNECLKKCEAVAGFADALTATLREAMR